MEYIVVKTIPKNFTEYEKSIMSNFDHYIDSNVEATIKDKPMYANYAGWDFSGNVWWENNQWHCEVWVYKSHVHTYSADSLKDLMYEVCEEHGYN